jgi:hypothetical protein
LHAAIPSPFATGITSPAIHIRLDTASIANRDLAYSRTDFQDLYPQFVPWDPRESKKRKLT